MLADPWWTLVNGRDGLEVAEALGLAPSWGRGRASRWAMAHGDCLGAQGDGQPAVYYASGAAALMCRKCGRKVPGVELVAIALGLTLPTSWTREDATLQAVQAHAAGFGWCPPPDSADPVAIARAQREARQRLVAIQERRAADEARRRGQALDVAQGWQGLIRRHDARRIQEWAQHVRGWPAELAQALPHGAAVIVADEDQDAGGHPGALAAYAWRRDRRLIIPIRDAHGAPASASCRWHAPGRPLQGPKALTLAADATAAGPLVDWPGGVQAFGDLALAVDRAARGALMLIGEGGPDYLAALALTRRMDAVPVTACSAQALPHLAAWMRAQLRARIGDSGLRPRVTLAPHHDDAGQLGAREARAILSQVADVRVAVWPDRCGDLDDVVRLDPLIAARTLLEASS